MSHHIPWDPVTFSDVLWFHIFLWNFVFVFQNIAVMYWKAILVLFYALLKLRFLHYTMKQSIIFMYVYFQLNFKSFLKSWAILSKNLSISSIFSMNSAVNSSSQKIRLIINFELLRSLLDFDVCSFVDSSFFRK